MPSPELTVIVLIAAFATALFFSLRGRRRNLASPPPEIRPAAKTSVPYVRPAGLPPSRWEREEADRASKARANAAKAKGWALFDPKDPTHYVDGVYEAGTEAYKARSSSFTPEEVARGRTIREWHPYWKAGLSSFIYHHTDLLDADDELIAQKTDWEDVRD